MSTFKKYMRTSEAELRPYIKNENMKGISVSKEDKKNNSPKEGDWIARNPANHDDQWLVSAEYFSNNFKELGEDGLAGTSKSYGNTDTNTAKSNVKDIVFWGSTGDVWKLISKASSKNERWMKSTKAMQVPGGCVIQVTTQQGDNIAEALVYVPDLAIEDITEKEGKVIGREFKTRAKPI